MGKVSDLGIRYTHTMSDQLTVTAGTGTTWGKWLVVNAGPYDVVVPRIMALAGNAGHFYFGKVLLNESEYAALPTKYTPFYDLHTGENYDGIKWDLGTSPSTLPDLITDEIYLGDNGFYPVYPMLELPRPQLYDGTLKYGAAIMIMETSATAVDADPTFTVWAEVIK